MTMGAKKRPPSYLSSANKKPITAFDRTQDILEWAKETGLECRRIYQRLMNGMDPEDALTLPAEPDGPLYAEFDELPYDQDVIAQALIARHGALVLDEVAAILNVSHQRAKQIETLAIKRFLQNARRLGLEQEMAGMLLERAKMAGRRERTWPDALEG